MDWEAFSDGVRGWVSLLSGISLPDVVWKGATEGWRGDKSAWLTMLSHSSTGDTDEVRLESQGPGMDARVRMTGNRVMTLSIMVRTRNQTPLGRAYLVLERVRDGLYLPTSQALLASIGVGLVGSVALVDLDRTFDMREESQAVLDIKLTAALDSLAGVSENVGTIERVITARV